MSMTREHRSERRGRVLLAARKCFIRHGFHATGMAEISKACRMSVGNIYRYFPNKAAIIQAIADETRTRVTPVFRRLEQHEDPVEGIVGMVLFSVKEFCRGSNARLWIDISAEASRNKLVMKLCEDFYREMGMLLQTLLKRAIQSGKIPGELDLEAASLWLIALLDGAIVRVSLEPGVDISRMLNTLAGSIRRCLCPQAC
jgi:AcrR family transcriptional regulator